MANKNQEWTYQFLVSADDGCKGPTRIEAASRKEAAEEFEKQTGKKAAHVAGNPFAP